MRIPIRDPDPSVGVSEMTVHFRRLWQMLDLVPFHRPILRRQLRGGVQIIGTSLMLTSHLPEENRKEKGNFIGDPYSDRQFLFSSHVRGQLSMLFRVDHRLFFGETALWARTTIQRFFRIWAATQQET